MAMRIPTPLTIAYNDLIAARHAVRVAATEISVGRIKYASDVEAVVEQASNLMAAAHDLEVAYDTFIRVRENELARKAGI